MSQNRSRKKTSRKKKRFKKAIVGGDGTNIRNGNDGAPRQNLMVANAARRNVARAKAKATARRKKIKDSLSRRNARLSNGDFKISIDTTRRVIGRQLNNDSGVEVRSTFIRKDDNNILRLRAIKIDEAKKLKDTVDSLQEMIGGDNEFGGRNLAKIQIPLRGVDNVDKLHKGLRELDRNISIEVEFKNTNNEAKILEQGLAGVEDFLKKSEGKPENKTMETLERMLNHFKQQEMSIQTESDVDQLIVELRSFKLIIPKETQTMSDAEKDFLKGFNFAIAREISRIENNVGAEKQRIRATKLKVENEFRTAVFNIKTQQANPSAGDDIKINNLVNLLKDISTVAKLTPNEVERLFKSKNILDDGEQKIADGKIKSFLEKKLANPDQDLDKLESDFRDAVAVALALLGKKIEPETVTNLFVNTLLNTDPPGTIDEPPKEGVKLKVKKLFRIGRAEREAARRRGERIQGNLEKLNSGTASDVYTATTEGNIGFSDTNQGFAKLALGAGGDANDTTINLGIPNDDNRKLTENPNLIARQVVSSRLDKELRIFSLADEVFSRDHDDSVIGISAKVKGKSVMETINEPGEDESVKLHRNFDFTNPNTQKGLSDLQLMDALTGQMDRHGGNIFIDPKTGQVIGIDNDMAFSSTVDYADGGNGLRNQFEMVQGKLVFKQNLIDASTGEKILKMKREDFERILRGEENDPEKLSDESTNKALLRFDAVKAKVQQLKAEKKLVKNWNMETFKTAMNEGGGTVTRANGRVDASFNFNNYVARSAKEFERAGTSDGVLGFNEVKGL